MLFCVSVTGNGKCDVAQIYIYIETGCSGILVGFQHVSDGKRAWGSVVVKVLRYKSEGPRIDSRCRREFFHGIRQFLVPWGQLSL